VVVKTEGLTHIHLVVRDMARSMAFYRDVFGMEEVFREGDDLVFLNTPGSRDMITLNSSGDPAIAGGSGGVEHFGFRLQEGADLDDAIKQIEAAGGGLIRRGEHAPGVAFAYVTDPDGYAIEL
jgi:catechol 2,3-dioxygenase-like lactoylglutathione lyase family enzyme